MTAYNSAATTAKKKGKVDADIKINDGVFGFSPTIAVYVCQNRTGREQIIRWIRRNESLFFFHIDYLPELFHASSIRLESSGSFVIDVKKIKWLESGRENFRVS